MTFCTHGNTIGHCNSCTPKTSSKLQVRWNWIFNCWQLWGIIKGSDRGWRWLCVETNWVKAAIDADKVEVVVEETVDVPHFEKYTAHVLRSGL